ncbi:PAS domain S-box-containing protein [Motilibacter rhizosphaerae]|uniref:PAS domain S-box-containing protein n=1 Tax=Motilibacter rhizosphaerae TaxID=598652 RepID=A0A4Q7NGC4_9ACTN|nr:SpoIIE family protein phosphatase [Motilibacter rhizosphaerae]RZS82997.1 PAS domain S-box-containing protein [Motilibacter rhizosphaerae]
MASEGQVTGTSAAAAAAAALDLTDSALLDTLVREAPLGFALYDADLRYRRINRVLASANGHPIEAHLGRRPSELLGDLGLAVEAVLRRVVLDGASVHDDDFVLITGDGSRTRWQSQWFPVRSEGRVVGVAVFVSDVTARRRMEDALRAAYRRGERLLTVTTRLAKALTLADVGTVLAEEMREGFGAVGASLAVAEAEQVAYVSGSGLPVLGGGPLPLRVPSDARTPTAVATRTGRAVYVSSVEGLAAVGLDPAEVGPSVTAAGEHSWAWLPLTTVTGNLGVLRVAFGESRTLPPEERVSLEALGGHVALAVERALLYDREHSTAQALQRSLLPARLPVVPGVELAARYLPAALGPVGRNDTTSVGGDWYDAFVLPDGRLAVVLGDVMGKGVRAAAGMGRVRSALRALAFTDPSPRVVLQGLDRVFSATEEVDQIVTLVYAVVDPVAGTITATSAGHPPVLAVRADGRAELLSVIEDSTPLGMPEGRAERVLPLGRGDAVVVFSDGLVETREGGIGAGLDALVVGAGGAAVRATDPSLDALLDVVVAAGVPVPARRDDVTVLGVRL